MLVIEELKDKVKQININFAIERITSAIRQYFTTTRANKAIIGISGGIDSSVTLALLVKALGKDRVKAVILPHTGLTPDEDIRDAENLARKFNVESIRIDISEIANKIRAKLNKENGIKTDKLTYGNIVARTRMIILYALSNHINGLVVGSGDKSELLLGYYTKYGDGGVDILPIGDLYKTQVRVIGKALDIPETIINKPSSPRLWPGQKAEDELGADYETIDAILYALIELREPIDNVMNIRGVSKEVIINILKRVFNTEHKRRFPFIPKLSPGMTIGIDWRIPRTSKFI